MSNKKIKAAIYARVSSTEQNPEAQLNDLREFAAKRGFEIYKEYVDHVTGDFSKRKRKRRQKDLAYEEIMSDASKRLFDCVLVWKYDRFARSLSALVTSLDRFHDLGVDFISYTQEIDTTTTMGRLFFNVIGSFAEFERELIVERVKAGLKNAKNKGIRLGRPEKDPTAKDRITTLRQEGWSLRKIAQREGLSAPGVLKILRRQSEAPDIQQEQIALVPEAIPEVWQLKIYLLLVKPLVWRRLLVPNDITLARLSDVIQKLFGWSDLNYSFVPRNEKGGYKLMCNENTFRLRDVDINPGTGMFFEHGWDWTHEVTFEKIVPFNEELQYPVCIAGAMTVPPEAELDGATGYSEVRKTKRRSKDLTVKTFTNGLPYLPDPKPNYSDFDHHHFDLDEINFRLGVASPNRKDNAKSLVETASGVSSPELYCFKISISGIKPEIWRRVQVSSETTITQFSEIIQILFDWEGYHLHKFMFPTPFGKALDFNQENLAVALASIKLHPGDSILYEYDFGDQWLHEIVLERVGTLSQTGNYPVCTSGKNAGPPEDCGGPEAYINARNYLSRQKGRRGKAAPGRISASEKDFYRGNYRGFDPDKFEKDKINKRLAELEQRKND